jgi:pantothenate kinase type III
MTDFSYLDIGNTSIKIRTTGFGRIFNKRLGFEQGWLDKVAKLLPASSPENVAFCSSNPHALRLLKGIGLIGPESMDIIKYLEDFNDMDCIQSITFQGIKGIGSDRKLGLYGAVKYLAEHDLTPDVICVLSYGTATTATIAQKKDNGFKGYACLGGSITSGLNQQSLLLQQLLPEIKEISDWSSTGNDLFGKSTHQALYYGLIESPVNAIINDLQSLTSDFHIVLTGGNSFTVEEYIAGKGIKYTHLPNLLLDSMESMVEKKYSTVE